MHFEILIKPVLITTLLLACLTEKATAGPYPPAAGVSGSTAISHDDSSIVGWATGWENYAVGSGVFPEWQDPQKALSAAGNSNGQNDGFTLDIVALGRGGSITLTFSQPIADGAGFDFAVFENSFSDGFLELAWVEISSNGIDYFRFETASLTSSPVGPFDETMDASNIDGLAGKYRGGYGMPFDISALDDDPNLDKNSISHIRLIDIIGDGSAMDDLPNPVGPNPIYDPYVTSESAGFDLDAIAVMHFAEEPIEENVPIPFLFNLLLACMLILLVRFGRNK